MTLVKHKNNTFVINVITDFTVESTVLKLTDFQDSDANNTSVDLYKSNSNEIPYINYELCKHNGIRIVKQDTDPKRSHISFIFSTDNIMTIITPEAYCEQICKRYIIIN